MRLSAGTRLGPYEILGQLGAGGMGEVYRARDTRLSREVAIKALPQDLANDPARLERFEKEARTASALNHPNIVSIYGIDTVDSTSFIVMELVDGRTLRELLLSGSIPLRRLLSLAAQTADGLAKAHAAGIVHRDLKPENLMVTKDGFVKIVDFGLAKLTPGGFHASEGTHLPTVTRATEPGTVLGTVGYMSPEQASGELADFRTDQFALGAILYEMASGQRAFDRPKPVQTLAAIIQEEPEPLAKIAPRTPTNLAWIIERCLAKDPEDRYASTKDLARDLAALRDHSSGISVSGSDTRAMPRRRRMSRTLALGTIGVAGLVGALVFFAGERRAVSLERPARYTQLTFRKGHITGARFAPDGKTVVYSAGWAGKASEIFETRLGSPESRPLGIFPAGIFAVSSTGEMAISLGCEDLWDPCYGTLARVPLSGGAPREVMEGVLSADWSPDGRELAVTRRDESGFVLEYPLGKVLYRTTGWLGSACVSPDGTKVAFVEHPSLDSARGWICLKGVSGEKRNVTGDLGYVGGLVWTPGGTELLFDGSSGLNAVSLTGKIRELYSPPVRAHDVFRDGRVLVVMGTTRAEIVALPPGASSERDLSWFDGSTAVDLSADGRDLLFHEWGGGHFTVYLRKTDGSDAKRLGEGKALALSPDGKWALAVQPNPPPQLVLLPTGAGEKRTLPAGDVTQYYWASWFPDSRRIFFTAVEKRGGARRSYVQDVEGGAPRPILRDGLMATLVSPDGQSIAATSVEGGAYLCSADGKGEEPIKGVLADDDLVQWSEDGRSLFVRSAERETLTLFRVDLATGKRDPWKALGPPDRASFLEFGSGPRGIRLTPDGKSYAFTCWTRLDSLGMIEGLK